MMKEPSIEISRIPPKLKMLTGTYILQTIRTQMYADEDAKCQLCKVETETLEHLLLVGSCRLYFINIFLISINQLLLLMVFVLSCCLASNFAMLFSQKGCG
jgi:hypothetical protein